MSKNHHHNNEQSFQVDKAGSSKHSNEGKESRWPLIGSICIIGCLVTLYFVVPDFRQGVDEGWSVLTSGDETRISRWVGQFGFWGPCFIMFAMVAQMFLLVINVVALMLVAIVAYGPFWGSIIAIAAVALASTVGYWLGRVLGKVGIHKIIGKKTEQKVADFMGAYGSWAIVIARVSPFLSNDAISFVAGIAGMNYFKFMAATLVGIVPLTLFLAWLGEDDGRLRTGLIWISAVSIVVFISYVIYKKYVSK